MKKKLQLPKEFRLFAPWEHAADRIISPLEEFIKSQTSSALALVFMTLLSLILANSSLQEVYHHFFEQKVAISFGDWRLSMSLHHWINDGLMALFFFLVGLEIKREILIGELSDFKAALLPVLAALGGMFVPALFYAVLNWGKPTLGGWGIPMATDIAFAISVLVLLGRRIPPSLVTFLVALAIVDDLGAVVVIALFYTDTVHVLPLALALGVWGLLWIFNRGGIHSIFPYFLGGVLMWGLMLASGIHATIAGVLTALAVPTQPKIIPQHFDRVLERLLDACRSVSPSGGHHLSPEQKLVIHAVYAAAIDAQPPSLRLEHALHLPVALLVIPLFALANAGVPLSLKALTGVFAHPVSLGIIVGLVLGKMLGILGTTWAALKLGVASLPSGARMSQILGVGLLGGIGFTMSIFIAELAWPGQEELLTQAKMGIICASLLAGSSGYLWLRFFSSSSKAKINKI